MIRSDVGCAARTAYELRGCELRIATKSHRCIIMRLSQNLFQTLRLLNHFNWLPWLHERAEKLKIIVGRERRLSLSVVRKPPKAVISGLPASESMEDVTGRDHRHHQGGSDGEGFGI